MKRLMIYAYTQFNLGDDLFIKVLCERYPGTNFVLHAPSGYKETFKDINNIHIHANDTLFIRGINFLLHNFIRRRMAKTCDAAIHIGGSLFIEQENWKKEYQNTKAMRIKEKPFFLLGANFGPFQDEDFYLEHKAIFQNYKDICFRDKHSFELFKDLPHVRMAADIVFQLDSETVSTERKNAIILSVIKPSIRKHLADYDVLYYRKMKEIAIHFMEKGYDVTLMSFCAFEGDQEAVESIAQSIPAKYNEQLTKHFYKTNIRETLAIIASASFIVASRFHAMILGWLFGIAVFPIVYSDKMTHVMEDTGFTGLYTGYPHLDGLTAEQVFQRMDTNTMDVSEQIQHAAGQFERLDTYLKG